jgi:ParB/RepB/Spo0J family partition protein
MTAIAAPPAVLTSTEDGQLMKLPLELLVESPWNPRKQFDPAKLQELADSMLSNGQLTPALARPIVGGPNDGKYELAAGHRRKRAAAIAGRSELLTIVRTMTDVQLLEVLTIENLQRDDVHPLEEARGYADLIREAAYSAERIAERVCKSVKYVYDRIKLLQLVPEAKKLFLDGRITAGHAILIARLAKDVQKTIVDPESDENQNNRSGRPGALWDGEHTLFHPEREDDKEHDPFDGLKVVSVRELEAYIDEHVRLDPRKDSHPLEFPEIAAVITPAREMNLKVVPITHEHFLPDSARSEEKTYGPKSWERADGKHGSTTCDFSVTGYIAAGAGRGEAFSVCIAKEKCKTHWPEQFKRAQERRSAAKKVAAGEAKKPSASAAEKAERERIAQEKQLAKEKVEQAERETQLKRFKAALPAILDRLAEHVAKMSAAATGTLAVEVIGCLKQGLDYYSRNKGFSLADKYIGKGKTAEDLVRYVAFISVAEEACGDIRDYTRDRFTADCKRVGFDVTKTLDEISPPAPKEKPADKPAKKKTR